MMSEAEKEEYKVQKEILFTVVRGRFEILPIISALSGALLVVATFNPKLIPVTIVVKVILAVLLFIIPLSLFGYLWELKIAEDKAMEWFEQFGGVNNKRSHIETILAYFPWIMFCVISVAIILIVIIIFVPVDMFSQKLWTKIL
ncbi:MAG: hypothetical protein A2571_01290 [Candidatus Vogelbacteria bacterium RIFOXYD1_FULL_44_32]|uniref:Uncharacterized protein n=1 Tax=Candidatus Vogelbacteria bacterium RIFOXYD1_FULL_44_32 TaxID=1802438 RepID=A0A1G2QCV0_9BACT|nr:MAG: hypothetical protein A2571_01290 [Candidatus Vogelbacteria bacterium RIFOXYD1_FULL_44_32]